MTARHPSAKVFSLEYPGSIIFDPFADYHFAANVHQIEHSSNCVASSSIRLFFLAPANPFQGVQCRGLRGPQKVKLDNAFQVLVRWLLRAHSQAEWGLSMYPRLMALKGHRDRKGK